jgi:hypothetical protein
MSINEQIGDHYDIFLGVMWSRFGTPTKESQSGTEEEFKRALERNSSGDEISVSFLFKTSPILTAILDGGQYTKVQEFKQFVGNSGCMYRDYADDASLINAISLIIDRAANGFSKITQVPVQKSGIACIQDDAVVSLNREADEEDGDIGLFEINDQIEAQGTEFVKHLEEWSARITEMGENVGKTTEVLNVMSRFGTPDQGQVRKQVERLSREIGVFTEWGEVKAEEIEECIDRYSKSFSQLVDVSKDFEESEDNVQGAIASM